MDFDGGLINVI